jgi:hypothetical protein
MTPPIIYYLFIIYLVSATAARVKHPVGHANIIYYLFVIYLLFSACHVTCAVCRVPCDVCRVTCDVCRVTFELINVYALM